MDTRGKLVVATLVLVVEGNTVQGTGKVLLGMKRKGFGQGKWNGFGGKLEQGESVLQAAKRELWEEAGIHGLDLQKRGVLTFEFTHSDGPMNSRWTEAHVFKCTQFKGTVSESEEMSPRWFDVSDIPYSSMWSDDSVWMPIFLQDKHFSAYFLFDGHESFTDHHIRVWDQPSNDE